MGRHLSPRYGQVILVSGYPVLTAVNWSQHWCPICVHYQFSCALKLARKYEIEHWSRSSKTINWSADSFQINHVTLMSWHMNLRYGHVILVSGYPILTGFNWPFCECLIYKMWTCQDTPKTPPPPSLLIVSPTPPLTICRHVRTLGQSRDNQTKKGRPYSMSMGLCPTGPSRPWEPAINFITVVMKWWLNDFEKMIYSSEKRNYYFNLIWV